jgi:hypothetical protein
MYLCHTSGVVPSGFPNTILYKYIISAFHPTFFANFNLMTNNTLYNPDQFIPPEVLFIILISFLVNSLITLGVDPEPLSRIQAELGASYGAVLITQMFLTCVEEEIRVSQVTD